jgi:hypothetical protein
VLLSMYRCAPRSAASFPFSAPLPMATVWKPIRLANWTPRWPSPPTPCTATRSPARSPQSPHPSGKCRMLRHAPSELEQASIGRPAGQIVSVCAHWSQIAFFAATGARRPSRPPLRRTLGKMLVAAMAAQCRLAHYRHLQRLADNGGSPLCCGRKEGKLRGNAAATRWARCSALVTSIRITRLGYD